MARRESWSVGELIIAEGGGIRAGAASKLAKTLRALKCVPAAKVANRYKTTGNCANGAYTLTATLTPGDGLAHNVSITMTRVDVVDTLGILTVTGLDIDGKIITEDITPVDNTKAVGNKAFASITSLVHSGWAQGGTGPDTCVIGFDDKIGLPECIAAAADIILACFDTAVVQAPTVAVSSTVLASNTITAIGDATKELKVIYQI